VLAQILTSIISEDYKMVDPKQDEIEIGDEILLVTVFKEKAHWSKHTVVGVTPCMVKIAPPCNWKGEKKGYSLVGPDRCIVVKKGEK
jgi:hypothetical protein